ncbi:MAG: DUF4397 domain-containing protein [Ktedonobacteraceae bacterium]
MKPKHSLARLVHLIPVTLGILALLGCFGIWALPASAQTQSPSFVRIIHASPDVGTADVFLDGSKLLSSFQFGAITDYASIPAGPHKVQIALVGKGINAAAITETLTVSPGTAYTVAAIGTNATGLSLKVFVDDNIIASGKTKVRVYQLSPTIGSIDVTAQGSTIASGVAYQQASPYVTLPEGSVTFDVNAPQANMTLSIAQKLKANTVTSILVVGTSTGSPKLELVPAQANGLPGLPGTGSDPRPLSTSSQPLTPWLLAALALLMIGTAVFARRLAHTTH